MGNGFNDADRLNGPRNGTLVVFGKNDGTTNAQRRLAEQKTLRNDVGVPTEKAVVRSVPLPPYNLPTSTAI